MTQAVLEGAAAAGAKLVLADNLYRNGPVDRPMTEDLPYAATNPKAGSAPRWPSCCWPRTGRAGRAPPWGGRPTTSARAGSTPSTAPPSSPTPCGGGRPRWIGPLDVPHTVSYLPDIARGLAVLAEREEADGQAWHLPAAEPVTGRQFLGAGLRRARPARQGRRPEPAHAARPRPGEPGGAGAGRDLVPARPALRAGREPVPAGLRAPAGDPHPEAIADTLDWFRRQGA
jgi:hypothetical protein